MPQPGNYYSPELGIFNDPKAPNIAALTGPERQRLIKAISEGVWGSATMSEQSIMLKKTPIMGEALKFAHERSLITPAGAFIAEILEEGRGQRIEREGREKVEQARSIIRDLGYPASLTEARQDPAALLAMVGGASLTAKMQLARLPEAERTAMQTLADNYKNHLEDLRTSAQAAFEKANRQLEAIERRGEEINAMLSQQPPTDAPEA